MKQLSGTDSLFLRMESGNQYMHVAGLGIYDPSSAPDGKVRFKDVLRFFESRLDALPVFRRRLVRVPLRLDRPYWIEDPHIDVEFHVRHIALPAPGDWRQLCIQVARIHARPLDRSKPLWEAYVIEGLDNIEGLPTGSFALYIKFHHCAVDGEAGTEILKAIHSWTAEDFSEPERAGTRYKDRAPSTVELYARAFAHNAHRVPQLAKFSAQTLARLVAVSGVSLADIGNTLPVAGLPKAAQLLQSLRKPPATRFAGKVSSHSVVEVVGLPMAGFRTIRQHLPDATINDIFMATVGGALREYLESKGELPDETLTCMLPMSFRGPDKTTDVGNQIGMAIAPLHTEIHDPVARLLAIKRGAAKAKAMASAMGRDLAARLFEVLPTSASEVITKRLVLPQMSIVVSNVRGPDAPLYMAGARLVNFAPVSIPFDGLGLNVTGFSYNGMLWICATACRDMMPDPGVFADFLRANFTALATAAQRAASHKEMPKVAANAMRASNDRRTEQRKSRRRTARTTPAR